ncbi:lytic polysaccharide monooxygenase [Amniculicola lignicola CBS 123094]|uniref:AA9 family lytic polysaccharide monooxygenase n=1 Tax=Amniculicola lignicola CBS 123094 TaxID=1392246 RepID=A0A6A5W3U0_9PLEO|nr:lytic polysaccharide monooxygenase [Amniculicola lignicola CBS 123094]
MKSQSFALVLAALPAAFAHTAFTDFFVDGVAVGDGVAIRIPRDPATATFPIGGGKLGSNTLACNVDGDKGVSRVQNVKDGATLTFEIRSWPNDPTNEPLDRGHKGPCAVYLKKVDSAIDDPGYGDGWFKLFDDGYDASSQQWCSDKIIDNNGLLSIVLPKGLQGGYYLARPEILALHAANNGDPQFYTGCAQIYLDSTGDLVPETTVSIPGYVKEDDASVTFDIYNRDNSEYTKPGPAVAKLTSGGAATASGGQGQTEGTLPEGCIAINDNWCGKEVPSYTDETGCWAADADCWAQAKVCWANTAVTGGKGCEIWQDKCNGIQSACKSKNFNGPPNKGKSLIPVAKTIDVGLIMPTVGGGVVAPQSTKAQAAASSKPVVSNSPPKNTPAASSAAAPKTSAAAPKTSAVYDEYEATEPTAVEAPAYTPVTTAAPEPTKVSCPPGVECVTVYHTVVKTEVQYTTVWVDPKVRRSIHARRHARMS